MAENNNKLSFKDTWIIILAVFPFLKSLVFNKYSKVCNKKKNNILKIISLVLPLVLIVVGVYFSQVHERVDPPMDYPKVTDYVEYGMDKESQEYKDAYEEYQSALKEWKSNPDNIKRYDKYTEESNAAQRRNNLANNVEEATAAIFFMVEIVLFFMALFEFSNYTKALRDKNNTDYLKSRISFGAPNQNFNQNQNIFQNQNSYQYQGGQMPVMNNQQPQYGQNAYAQTAENTVPVPQNNVPSEQVNGGININSATEEQLGSLPGITIIDAKKAVSYRDQNGAFSSTDEFFQVIGAKPHIVAKVADMIYVGNVVEKPAQNVKRHLDL